MTILTKEYIYMVSELISNNIMFKYAFMSILLLCIVMIIMNILIMDRK
jgi:hypothetical protein